MYKNYLKFPLDVLCAALILLILSPFIIIIIFIIPCTSGYGPFFIQSRPGLNGRIFNLIKFRTMTNERDSNGKLKPDSERLTRLGRMIRSASIDELPQLINVIKGDMSIVGPRPLLIEYLPLYNKDQARRHSIRPGITGWAQVNGRNAISWEERFQFDIWYIDNISFKLDVRILWLTIIKALKHEGINSPDAATMKPFRGNED